MTQTEALKRIAAYPFSRAEELSVEKMREIAREALAQPEQEPVAIPDWPESESLADLEYAQNTPETWEPEYRQVWQELQVAERNKAILRRYAKELRALLTTPPQRKPQFKEFIKWAGAQGYDCAQTCNSDTGEWIVFNPMTADLWKAWQAAHGIKE